MWSKLELEPGQSIELLDNADLVFPAPGARYYVIIARQKLELHDCTHPSWWHQRSDSDELWCGLCNTSLQS